MCWVLRSMEATMKEQVIEDFAVTDLSEVKSRSGYLLSMLRSSSPQGTKSFSAT